MHRVLFCSAAVAALAAGAASAQPAEDPMRDEIIVYTQKREQSVQDVPIAVTAYSEEQLKRLGVQQFDELADYVPGLEVQEQSPNNPGFVIRGITSDSGAANIEPRVSVFQDGVSISRSRGSFVELFDASVEVAKGPQSTLFGRSALIGAINIIQNKPTYEFDAEIRGVSLHTISREVLGLSRQGLQRRARLNDDGNDEAHFLAPLEETVARGTTAAGLLLDLYHGKWHESVEPVFEEFSY